MRHFIYRKNNPLQSVEVPPSLSETALALLLAAIGDFS